MTEVRDAAERLRRWMAGEPIAGIYPTNTSLSAENDRGILADAYLAEHPADDAEPVDEAWLRGIGFVDYCTRDDGLVLLTTKPLLGSTCGFVMMGADGTFVHIHQDRLHMDAYFTSIPNAKSRGSVRRLLAALSAAPTGERI